MAARKADDSDTARRRPPATTPEQMERRIIMAAYELAEKQILSGNVSSQVLTHFLKGGSPDRELERAKLKSEVHLLDARVENLDTQKNIEALYGEAIAAMRSYQGLDQGDSDEN